MSCGARQIFYKKINAKIIDAYIKEFSIYEQLQSPDGDIFCLETFVDEMSKISIKVITIGDFCRFKND